MPCCAIIRSMRGSENKSKLLSLTINVLESKNPEYAALAEICVRTQIYIGKGMNMIILVLNPYVLITLIICVTLLLITLNISLLSVNKIKQIRKLVKELKRWKSPLK
jgi:hypothetical protein